MARKYRGKYPTRIRSAYSAKNDDGTRCMRVETNDGTRYSIHVARKGADLPKLGQEWSEYCAANVVYHTTEY